MIYYFLSQTHALTHSEDLQLDSIVHIQQNVNGRFQQYPEPWQSLYFVELDIQRRRLREFTNTKNNGTNKTKKVTTTITRFSQLVHLMDRRVGGSPQQSIDDVTSDGGGYGHINEHGSSISGKVGKNGGRSDRKVDNKDGGRSYGENYKENVDSGKNANGVGDSSDICFMADWKWRKDVGIDILTPIRNQIQWLEYLLVMLKKVLDTTGESKVRIAFNLFWFLETLTDTRYIQVCHHKDLQKHTDLIIGFSGGRLNSLQKTVSFLAAI